MFNLNENKKNEIKALIPGYIQGATKLTIAYPFETVKVHMQSGRYKTPFAAFKDIIKTKPSLLYKGSQLMYITSPLDRALQFYVCEKYKEQYSSYLIGCLWGIAASIYTLPASYICNNGVLSKERSIWNIIRTTPIKQFYNGFAIECARSSLATTIYIGIYFHLREKYKYMNSPYIFAGFGCIANISCWLVSFPLDSIRTEVQTTKNKSYFLAISNKYNKGGIKQFYKGITPVMFRTFPAAFGAMFMYEKTRSLLKLN